jgi:hypothetical protein
MSVLASEVDGIKRIVRRLLARYWEKGIRYMEID